MPTVLPVFQKEKQSGDVSQIIESLVAKGIVCVRISVAAKDSYPKTLKGGFAPEDINRKSRELNPSDPKAPPFPAMTATTMELNTRIASIKRRLVKGFSPQSGRTEFFVSEEKFPQIEEEINQTLNWLEEQKRLLEGVYDLTQKEWHSKCDSMIAFMGQKKDEYSQDYLDSVERGWKSCFPSRSSVNAMSVSFSYFPITSVKEVIENEMVKSAISDIYNVFASSVQEAAREVNAEIENCLSVLLKGAKDKRSTKSSFVALATKIDKVKSFLYSEDSEIGAYLTEVLKASDSNLATANQERLSQIEKILKSLRTKANSQSRQAEKVSNNGHISSVDVSEIPIFDDFN